MFTAFSCNKDMVSLPQENLSSKMISKCVFTACSLSDWDQLASGLFLFGLDPLLLDDEDDTAASMSGRIPTINNTIH